MNQSATNPYIHVFKLVFAWAGGIGAAAACSVAGYKATKRLGRVVDRMIDKAEKVEEASDKPKQD